MSGAVTVGLVAVGVSAGVAAVLAPVILTIASVGLSFVASALLRPPAVAPKVAGSGASQSAIDNKITSSNPIGVRQIILGTARVGGNYAFIHTTDDNNFLHLIIVYAGHQVHRFGQIWIGDEAFFTYEARADAGDNPVLNESGEITTGQFAGKVVCAFYTGTDDQLAHQPLVDAAPGFWTADHRLRGLAYAYIRLEWDYNGEEAKVWSGGVPNITAVIDGKCDVRDPRASTVGWSSNPALLLANYLADTRYGLGVDFDTGIDQTALIAAANACDENVEVPPVGSGIYEQRFSANGSFPSSDQPQDVIGRLLGAMHGKAPYDGARWRIMAGVAQTPTLNLSDEDLRAGPKVRTLLSRRDRFNAVKGTFVSPKAFYVETDFPSLQSVPFAAQDNGTIWQDIVLPYTNSPSMAQRIAKISLLAGRQEITATMPCNLGAWRCQAGDTITWTSFMLGWDHKKFEVRKVTFAADLANGGLGVDLELAETDPSIYDMATSEQDGVDPAPNTTLPNPFVVTPPTNLTVEEQVYDSPGVGVRSRAFVNWSASTDAMVDFYQLETRLVGDAGVWKVYGSIVGTYFKIEEIPTGIYNFRVKAINRFGSASSYVTIETAITGNVTPPEDVTDLVFLFAAAYGPAQFGVLQWSPAQDARVRIGGLVEIRRTASTGGGATWETATLLLTVPGSATSATVPVVSGTYFVKFKTATGVYSTHAASVVSSSTSTPGYQIVNSLPSTGNYVGRMVYLTSDDKLYRYTGAGPFSGWERATAAADIAGQITTTQISDNAISTPKLQAASVDTANLIAGSVLTDKLGAGQVTAAKLASTEVSAMYGSFGNMIAGTVTGVTVQTAATGIRGVMDGTTYVIRVDDSSYASRTYYRGPPLAEPSWVSQMSAGYLRIWGLGGGIAVNGIAYGDVGTPANTPLAQGGYFKGDFAGATGEGAVGVLGLGTFYDFYGIGVGTYGPFTAAHDAVMAKDEDAEPGDILENVEMLVKKNISTTLRKVRRATGAANVRRCGVFIGRSAISDFGAPAAISITASGEPACLDPAYDDYKDLYDRVAMNALGEGQIKVCGDGGTIFAVGDLIVVSSDTPGKGMRQGDDIVRSSTMARCEEDVELAEGEVRFIGCVYLNA